MLTAHTPHEVVVVLIVGVHVAIVEVHVPRVRGIVRICRRRPIVGRLHACLPTLADGLERQQSRLQPSASPEADPRTRGVQRSCTRMP